MIKILRVGTNITVVDQGRYGYLRYGVPFSGAMDKLSAAVANALVGNDQNQALLEFYMPGHKIQFSSSTTIALTGANAHFLINDSPILSNQAYLVDENSILSIGKLTSGAYVYMAVKGGIQSRKILGSRSPLPSSRHPTLKTGDTIPIGRNISQLESNVRISPIKIDTHQAIMARPGPEWQLLSKKATILLRASSYTISQQSNRMGFRMEGPSIQDNITGILSSGVTPGTVQLLPSGLPLILMRDCQTTGGYLRILQITPKSLNQLAQRAPGQQVIFDVINGQIEK